MCAHLKSVTLHPEGYPTRERYPFSVPVLQQTKRLPLDACVTLFVGENGTGKSTLLEAIATTCGIHIWRPMEGRRYEVNPYEQTLWEHVTVDWTDGPVPGAFFGSDIARHFAFVLEEWAADDPGQLKYFGGKSLVTQSHGESLLSFFRARYRVKGLYLLDEPETALSPRSQLELLRILAQTTTAGMAQFIIVTHSPLLLACPRALIYSFDRCPIGPIAYEQTEHYQLYRSFLNDRSQWLTDNR